MKLTPELIASTPTYLNPLGDRELSLRGRKIPTIENLGVTRDQIDTLDLTDNDVLTLANFPHLDRLAHLLLSNNLISRIDARLAWSLPRLTSLVLTNNQIASFAQLKGLGKFPMLQYLTLIGNPVAREKYYREWIVSRCKTVRVLDYRRVKDKVRVRGEDVIEGSLTDMAISCLHSAGTRVGKVTHGDIRRQTISSLRTVVSAKGSRGGADIHGREYERERRTGKRGSGQVDDGGREKEARGSD